MAPRPRPAASRALTPLSGLLLGAGGVLASPASPARSAGAQPPAPAARPALERGAKVRLTLADTAGFPRGNASGHRVEARFVSFDSSGRAVIVRLYRGDYLAVPDSGVRRLDVRSGRGFCTAGRRNRIACLVGGAGAGYVLGYALGYVMGGDYSRLPNVDAAQDADARARRRATERRLAAVGAGLGFGVAFTLGRDRWTRVAGWPPPHP